MKTPKERLLEEFECAINAVLGDCADDENYEIECADIDSICHKVKFYMDL